MEPIDHRKARQVWQRVTASPGFPTEDRSLHLLALAAGETMELYRQLAQALSGSLRDQSKILFQRQQETYHTLLGLQRLSPGRAVPPRLPKAPAQPSGKLAAQCFQRSKEALTEYTARSVGTDFGPVFRQLAEKEQAHCAMIACLLGQMST